MSRHRLHRVPAAPVARQRVPVAGAPRDLGGLPTPAGPTRSDVLWRAAAGPAAVAALAAGGVDAVVDLRASFEVDPDLTSISGCRRVPVPLTDAPSAEVHAERLRRAGVPRTGLTGLYHHLLDEAGSDLAAAVTLVATTDRCLVWCSNGRDRTGLLVALLLDVAGVPRAAIAEDWARSLPVVSPVRLDRPGRVSTAPIAAALEHLRCRWGGASGYLRQQGVAPGLLDTFRARFVGARTVAQGQADGAGEAPALA